MKNIVEAYDEDEYLEEDDPEMWQDTDGQYDEEAVEELEEEIDAEELLNKRVRKAKKIIDNPNKVEKLLKNLERRLRRIPKLGGALVYIPQMGMLINSFIRKEYTGVSLGTIAAVAAVLLYFVAPIDAIADVIPGIGLLDDAAVAGAVIGFAGKALSNYMEWRKDEGLDCEDFIAEGGYQG